MKYTEDHEWLKAEGDIVTVGITAHAAEELGEIVFVELPDVGSNVTKGDDVVVIESVKAASDICAPLDGEVVDINTALTDTPGLVNDAPTEGGWFFKLKITEPSALDAFMDEAAYKTMIS